MKKRYLTTCAVLLATLGVGGAVQAESAISETSWVRIAKDQTMTADGNYKFEVRGKAAPMTLFGDATIVDVATTSSGAVLDQMSAALGASLAGTGSGCTTLRATTDTDEFMHITCPFRMKCIVSSTLPAEGPPATDLHFAPFTHNGLVWKKATAVIPTLSQWGLILFGLLMLTAMFVTTRRRGLAVQQFTASVLVLMTAALIAVGVPYVEVESNRIRGDPDVALDFVNRILKG